MLKKEYTQFNKSKFFNRNKKKIIRIIIKRNKVNKKIINKRPVYKIKEINKLNKKKRKKIKINKYIIE